MTFSLLLWVPASYSSYSRLRYPLGLVILVLLSLLATSVVFEQHDVLVRGELSFVYQLRLFCTTTFYSLTLASILNGVGVR